ncbi:Ger(x)C family spore germination protein [Pseudalkalibacillus hwajinpoensis]|uniref:Ger(X)C family spore germination protein n=1 Tax=Guptibacillus hwajinpoensis TaxID=208199 RepID=A0A4U1MMR3_9BACL|nr:Ger(x)C family spore germination protein [Pseudalkalibacillus hwajinpoensis]TKD72257.1 Ger(x)C family spore germination protein [Pseudalkalibacillus hwajinpoensis]
MKLKQICLSILLINSSLLLTGCWDHNELPAYGFVQAVAIDLSEGEEKIDLTTQFIKPSPKIGSAGGAGEDAFVNIETSGDSIFEAIRDITTHLGRKAQWSHTRVILISEDIAKSRNIGEILEFFYRDHEPRMLITLGIMEGKAKDYLDQKPFIENTISQQLKEIEEASHKYSSKAMEVNLLTFGRELKSQTRTAKIPYYHLEESGEAVIAGLAIINNGKMSGAISPLQTEALLTILGDYQFGIIEVPCEVEGETIKETIEVSKVETDMKASVVSGNISAMVKIDMEGDVGELKCTVIDKSEDMHKFNQKVADVVKTNIEETLQHLQKDEVDVIGLGNAIYRKHPKVWKELQKDWPETFSEVTFTVDVKMDINNTGSDLGKPFFE